MLVCHWMAWDGFLCHRVYTHARALRLDPRESGAELVARIDRELDEPGTVLMQVNLSDPTRLPRERGAVVAALRGRGHKVWNGAVGNVGKSALQQLNVGVGLPNTIAHRRLPPETQVIVKDELNARAWAERRLAPEDAAALGLPTFEASPVAEREDYPVMRVDEVPRSWWDDRRLHVERYVSNAVGLRFRVYLAGERAVICSGRSASAVCRMEAADDRINLLVTRSYATGPLGALLPSDYLAILRAAVRIATAIELEFGAIDAVIDDRGDPYVIDVNPTPYWSSSDADEMLAHLAAA